MGFFNKLLNKKKSCEEIITECKSGVFNAYSIGIPTNEQHFNATLSIAIALVGILNDLGKGQLNHLIDEISDTARSMTSNLTFKIEDIAENEEEIELIISEMPSFAEAAREMRTNGGALFPILFNSRGPKLVSEIAEHSGGPLGAPGYAAIVIGDMVVGREESKNGFMTVSMQLMQTLPELMK